MFLNELIIKLSVTTIHFCSVHDVAKTPFDSEQIWNKLFAVAVICIFFSKGQITNSLE